MNASDLKTRIVERYPLPLCVVGEGISGTAAKSLLQTVGFSEGTDYVSFDDKAMTATYRDSEKMLAEFKPRTLIVSPGVPLKTPWIQRAVESGIRLGSELSLAALSLKQEKVVGVTGSLGKSTTVSILGAGLARFSDTGFVGGNLGTPLAVYASEVVRGQRPPADWVVLELSSYQLENLEFLPIHHAAITYLSPNHLERYANLEAYYAIKWRLNTLCRGKCVLNASGGDLVEYSRRHPGATRTELVDQKHTTLKTTQLAKSKLVGRHNWDNIAVAFAVARNAEWPDFCVQGMLDFCGLPHRMQNVGAFRGVTFINDSKATAMESVLTATRALMGEPVPAQTYLLLGGKDKKLPWQELAALSGQPGLNFVFFGECGDLAQQQSGLAGPVFPKLGPAIKHLAGACVPGDRVLLSPGGTSLDEFRNFEDRGRGFVALAREYFV